MKLENSFPAEDGFRMPGEFERHAGTVMIWPVRPGSWRCEGKEAKKVFTRLIAFLSEGERVWLLAAPGDIPEAEQSLLEALSPEQRKNVELLGIPSNDAWARDIGPSCVARGKEVRAVSWEFNAWGGEVDGLYPDYALDNAAAARIAEALGMDYYEAAPFVLEGGSIHTDGEGTVLVTEACLLSRGRNPSLSREEIEERLKKYLGAEKVIWLPYGIYQDETNEHVDNVCAFTAPGELVLAWAEEGDPQYEMSLADLRVLEQETDARGRRFLIRKLPVPRIPVCIREEELSGFRYAEGEAVRQAGERLAASYVNFYIGNECVLIPAFGDENDERALEILTECFPDRRVISVPAREILLGGGNIHCITQQIPAGSEAGTDDIKPAPDLQADTGRLGGRCVRRQGI